MYSQVSFFQWFIILNVHVYFDVQIVLYLVSGSSLTSVSFWHVPVIFWTLSSFLTSLSFPPASALQSMFSVEEEWLSVSARRAQPLGYLLLALSVADLRNMCTYAHIQQWGVHTPPFLSELWMPQLIFPVLCKCPRLHSRSRAQKISTMFCTWSLLKKYFWINQ